MIYIFYVESYLIFYYFQETIGKKRVNFTYYLLFCEANELKFLYSELMKILFLNLLEAIRFLLQEFQK